MADGLVHCVEKVGDTQQKKKTQIVQFANSINWYLGKKFVKKRKDEKHTCYLKIIKEEHILSQKKNTDRIT